MSITKISPSVVDFDAGITISTADNTDTLTLTSTDADANSGPNLNLYRNSGSPADNDVLGYLKFTGVNDNSEIINYARIRTDLTDASDGTEDGSFYIFAMNAGTERTRVSVLPSETVFNDESQNVNFRVESDGNTRAISILGDKYGLGVGRDPESAYNGYSSVELGQQGAILANDAGDDIWLGSNVYLDGSGNSKRKEAGVAALLQIDGDVVSWYTSGSDSADTTISWSMKNRFSNDGNLSFNSGQGIDFSATGDGTGATVGSEVLDDYEEGTWSPGIGEGAVTISRAHYTKIGRLVHFAVLATGFTNRTSSNQLVFNNLPFPVLADHCAGTAMANYNDETNAQAVYVTTAENVMFYAIGTGGYLTMAHNDLNNSSASIYFFGTYTAE